MTSGTLRTALVVGAALAALSVTACNKNNANASDNTAAAADNSQPASNTAMSASNTAAMAANTASNDASATAPASANSMSK